LKFSDSQKLRRGNGTGSYCWANHASGNLMAARMVITGNHFDELLNARLNSHLLEVVSINTRLPGDIL